VDDIAGKVRGLLRIGDEIAKVVVVPQTSRDILAIYRAAQETSDVEKIILGMGSFGINTRILANHVGAFLSYTSAAEESDVPLGAAGQMSPREMVEQYRFREITAATDIYGIVGFPLFTSFSPHIFNTAFSHEKIDAVYVPFPAHNVDYFLELANELGIRGASVTIPYKEEIIPHLRSVSESVRSAGACNTIKAISSEGEVNALEGDTVSFGNAASLGITTPLERALKGWSGINTDTMGFSESLLHFIGKKNFRRLKITVLGAGGAARAVVSEIHRLKGKCLILNRTAARARELALNYDFKWGGMDSQALDTIERYSDIIIQTTSVGTFPAIDEDPFESYRFKGYEVVMDLIYNPPLTAFLRRAQAAGCSVLNGFDMLVRQAKYQYQYFFERDFPEQLIPRLAKVLQG
jgi:3-dehydroquinate dehydratase/shikimate dehydrogenase